MKTALITGANKGIGFETARQLLQNGCYVFLASRDPQKGLQAVERLRGEGCTHVTTVALDVTDTESVKAARLEIGKRTDVLDILINNAGINAGAPYTALEAAPEQFLSAFDTNVTGVARVAPGHVAARPGPARAACFEGRRGSSRRPCERAIR